MWRELLQWMNDPDVPPVPSHFSVINIDINSKSKNNRLAVRDATLDNDWWGKVPHLAPWQRATALSGLMNYIDTQAILMASSIYPSLLSFLSLFPALGLAPASSHCSHIQSWFLSLQVCVCVCVCVVLDGSRLLLSRLTICSEVWFKSIWSYLLLTAGVSSGWWLMTREEENIGYAMLSEKQMWYK